MSNDRSTRRPTPRIGVPASTRWGAAAILFTTLTLAACGTDTYQQNGTSTTKTTRTVESPNERSTTTTTHETKVQDAPR